MIRTLLTCLLLLTTLSDLVIIDSSLTPDKEFIEYFEKLLEMRATNEVQTKVLSISGGRKLICYIPIANQLISRNSTNLPADDVSDDRILPLRHLCAVYRTREFLYEVCSGKHVRQFDDAVTIQNMGKKDAENIQMGKSNKIDTLRKLGRRLIGSVAKKDRYVIVRDRVGLTNYRMPFTLNKYGVDTINLTCHDGQTLLSQIVKISATQFILTSNYQGYCLAKVEHHSIEHGVTRIRLEQSSFLTLGNILIGACKAE